MVAKDASLNPTPSLTVALEGFCATAREQRHRLE
jgi:hypothetical protein